MTANAIKISSRLEEAGMEKRIADTVASELVEYSNEQAFTKADGARLEAQMRMMMAVQVGTFIGIILLFLGILTK